MLIGIDVGGTYTDGVLFSEGSVLLSVKQPTDENDLGRHTFCPCWTSSSRAGQGGCPTRLVHLHHARHQSPRHGTGGKRTALLLLPGARLPFSAYRISPDTYFLKRRHRTSAAGRSRPPMRKRWKEVLKKVHDSRHTLGGRCEGNSPTATMPMKGWSWSAPGTLYPHMGRVHRSNEIAGKDKLSPGRAP